MHCIQKLYSVSEHTQSNPLTNDASTNVMTAVEAKENPTISTVHHVFKQGGVSSINTTTSGLYDFQNNGQNIKGKEQTPLY